MLSVPPRWFPVMISATLSRRWPRSSDSLRLPDHRFRRRRDGGRHHRRGRGRSRASAAAVEPIGECHDRRRPPGVRRLFAIGALRCWSDSCCSQRRSSSIRTLRAGTANPGRRSARATLACRHIGSHAIGFDSARPTSMPRIYRSLPAGRPGGASCRVRPLGPLIVDQDEYPPSFLVLPRLIAAATSDFWAFRRVWFALNLAVVVAACDPRGGRFDRAVAITPLLSDALRTPRAAAVITFVIGNVQLAIIAVSMVAMLMFERQRHATGGVLLAYAVVSKLYPGLLVLYLLLRRDWRAPWPGPRRFAIVSSWSRSLTSV